MPLPLTHNKCDNLSNQPREETTTNKENGSEKTGCCAKHTMDSSGHTENSNQGKVTNRN